MKQLLIIVLCIIMFAGAAYSQVVDEYTVGTGGDFTSLGEMTEFLDTTTVTRTNVFNILAGEYNEHIVLNEVSGVSSDNQIIIQSADNDPDSVRIYYEATEADSNYIITINGTDHLVLQYLTLDAVNSQYGNAIIMTGDPNHIQIRNNNFQSVNNGRAIYGDKVSSDSLLISNNTFTGFNEGVVNLGAPNAEYVYGLIFDSNQLTNTGPMVQIQRYNNSVITGNIQDNTATNVSAGIKLSNCYGTSRIEKNRITTRSGHCIHIWNSGNSSARGLIANNFMEGVHGQGAFYGIDIYNGVNYDVLYNTVIEDHSPNAFGGVFPISGGSGNVVKNNLIVSRLGVIPIGMSSTSLSESDYNNIYTSGTGYYKIDNTTYRNLDSVKANTTFEQHSQDIYPIMTTLYEPYHQSPWLNGAGTPVAEVTDDIDGNPRDPSNPDIGCTEYTPDPSLMTPMAGEYTIGDGGDYATINEAVEEVRLRGISALTEFKMLPGDYKESVYLRSIPGTTEINELIFGSTTGNAEDVHIQYPTGIEDNYAFYLNGVDHVGITGLTIERDPDYTSGSGTGIYFNGETADISIISNILNGSIPAYGQDYIMYSYGMFTDRLYIGFNKFNSLGYGSGGWLRSMNNSVNVILQGNEYYCRDGCLDIEQAYGVQLLNNKFICTGGAPLKVVSCNGPIVIDGNKIIREGGYGQGLEIRNCVGEADSPGLISNNFIQGTSPTSSFNGIGINGSSYQNFYHNNINVTSANGSAFPINIYFGGSNLNFANNVFVNAGGGLVYKIQSTGAFTSSDFNDLYTTGANLVDYGGEIYPTIDSFQTALGFDLNSVSVNPCFYSKTDLHVRASELDNTGSFVMEVLHDYDGDLRTNPGCDIGADEFYYMPNDPPVAVDDSVTAYKDSTTILSILLNDYDNNGDSLIITYLSDPPNGTLAGISGSLFYEYTPDVSYNGPDSFYYVIADGLGCYDDTAWVYITVDILNDIIIHPVDLLPQSFELSQNYPNPFNPSTTLDFSLPYASEVEISIYNIIGQKVITLARGFYSAGMYSVTWDGRDKHDIAAASGIYFCIIKTADYSESKKMILLK